MGKALVLVVLCAAGAGSAFAGLDTSLVFLQKVRGEQEAQRDIRSGKPAVMVFVGGRPPPFDPDRPPPRTVDEKTGLKIRRIGGGCVLEPDVLAFMNGYNRAIFEHFRTRDLPVIGSAPSGTPTPEEIAQARQALIDHIVRSDLEERIEVKLRLFPHDPKTIACLNVGSERDALSKRIESDLEDDWNSDWSRTLVRDQLLRRIDTALESRSCGA